MIMEFITCDTCDWTDAMPASVVPSGWMVEGSKHYCPGCCRGVCA